MLKLFFYWLFHKSKTLQQISNNYLNHQSNAFEKEIQFKLENYSSKTNQILNDMINNIRNSLELNQNRSLRRKWKRITENKNSPFYIYK